jgi:hypothetical protein
MSGTQIAPAVQFTASAMLYLLIVGNYKVRLCMASNIHTKFRENRSLGSEVEMEPHRHTHTAW